MRIIGVRQLRDELARVMDEIGRVGEIIVTQRGEGKAVLVGLDRYNAILDRLEYLEDSLDALEAGWQEAASVGELA